MSGPISTAGVVNAGVTAQECADYIVSAPEWDFAHNPVKAVTEATVNAAQSAVHIIPISAERGRAQARFWASVLSLLVIAADNPHVTLGAVGTELVARYGASPDAVHP